MPKLYSRSKQKETTKEDLKNKKGKKMKTFLGFACWFNLALIPTGLIVLVTGFELSGLSILVLGFLGIWLLGEYCYKKGLKNHE